MSFRKIQRTRQPNDNVGINWSHPLAKKLAFAYIPTTPVNIVTNAKAVFDSNCTTRAMQPGVCFYQTALQKGVSFGTGAPNLLAGSDVTFLVFANPASSGIVYTPAISQREGTTFKQAELVFNSQNVTTSAGYFEIWVGDGTSNCRATSNSTVLDGNFHVYAGTFATNSGSNVAKIFIDGVEVTSTQTGSSVGNWFDNTQEIAVNRLGNNNTTGTQTDYAIALAWNRALTPVEIYQISKNPWQLFTPQKTPIFVPVSVSGDATALGTIAAATAAFIAGTATGQINSTASGVTINATASFIAGTASGATNATASGALLAATSAFLNGTATASSAAAGVILDSVSVLLPGSASGNSNVVVSGSLLESISSFLAGTATADSLAVGVTMTATASFIAGAATGTGDANVPGITASATTQLIAGTATGQINTTATGVIMTAISTLLGGGATGNVVGTSVPNGRIHISISISI